MPTLEVRTPEGITLRRELAGPASRFIAILLDAIVVLLGLLLWGLLVLVIRDTMGIGDWAVGVTAGAGLLILPAYFLLCNQLMEGQTPGKLALELRIVSANGYPAGAWQYLLRSLLLLVDLLPGLPVSAGFVVAMLSERKQRLGDIVAGTIVVRDPRRQKEVEPYANLSYSTLTKRHHEFTSSVAGKLGRSDMELLRALLARQGMDESARRRLFIRAGRHYAQKVAVTDFQDARLFLRDLYLFLREAREARA